MANAGYSNTPLQKKLGIQTGQKLLLINQPDNYFELIEQDFSSQLCKATDTPDFVHLFVRDNQQFEKEMEKIKPAIARNSRVTIWVSWYKKSAGISTDVTEDVIRRYALKNDLVDVKVCAVTDVWSGLKLVVPLKKR